MKKRFVISEMVFSFLLIIALLHTIIHLSAYGFRGNEIGERGISGFLVGESDVGENLAGSRVWTTLSRTFVFVEWMFVGVAILFLHFRQKSGTEDEYTEVKSLLSLRMSPTETDLDRLYEVLKIRKTIRLSTISRVFNVNKEVAMDWCRTLEQGNFASIEYPRFGEPQLVLEESVKGGNNEEEN